MTFRGAMTTANSVFAKRIRSDVFTILDVRRMHDAALWILCELIPQALRLRLLPSIALHADISRIHDQIRARCLI